MRKSFVSALKTLDEDIVKMATTAGFALDKAIESLTTANLDLADHVEHDDDVVDKLQLVIDRKCLETLIRYQPLAGDMRLVLAVLKMTGEIERMGDQAADVAFLTKRILERGYTTYDYSKIVKMAKLVRKMLDDVIESYIKKDLELAITISEKDNEVDTLYRAVRKELRALMATNPNYIDEGITYFSIAKYVERIGDHITNVSEWVIYTKSARFAKDRKYDDEPTGEE